MTSKYCWGGFSDILWNCFNSDRGPDLLPQRHSVEHGTIVTSGTDKVSRVTKVVLTNTVPTGCGVTSNFLPGGMAEDCTSAAIIILRTASTRIFGEGGEMGCCCSQTMLSVFPVYQHSIGPLLELILRTKSKLYTGNDGRRDQLWDVS